MEREAAETRRGAAGRLCAPYKVYGEVTVRRFSAAEIAVAVACFALAAGCWNGCENPFELAASSSDYLSPECLAVSPDGETVYLTCATAQRVMAVGQDGTPCSSWRIETAKTEAPVPVNPTGIAVASDGGVWVTCGVQGGELHRYGKDGKRLQAISVGHSPRAPVVSPDGRMVYVLNRFSARIIAVDVKRMAVVKTWSALREPFAAALGAEGRYLFVANMLPFCGGDGGGREERDGAPSAVAEWLHGRSGALRITGWAEYLRDTHDGALQPTHHAA